MFDYNLLDDLEFESLCRDIMSIKLGKELYQFPRGRDGGIDISDDESNPKIIIQVKHYAKSSVSNLMSSLREEKDKIQNLKPENYYLFTSIGLTRKKRIEIIEMFSPYMKDLENIVTKDEIDIFLNDSLNRGILNKHHRLWIQSVNILSEFQSKAVNMDSYALLSDIDARKKYYVKTQSYEKALKKIGDNNILLLLGNPGTGKTTICEMIVLEYLKNGYQVIYASTNDLKSVKESIIQSSKNKQIILLDDFLGQHYLKVKDTKSSELKMLISFIKTLENTKLVLNSRVTILNEAVQKDNKFRELYENYSDYVFRIDMDSVYENEKNRIFKNHLVYNEIPANYLEYLKADNRFLDVINHVNFNPRIIEYVTNKRKTIGKTEESYYNFILSKLDDPKDVWRDEFENRIEPIDRIFIYILYSISEGKTTNENLKLAFEKRISDEKFIDMTINNYERTLKRLSNSLIKITEGYNELEISIINPSLSEYVYKILQENSEEQRKILKNAYFYDQIPQTVTHKLLESDRVRKLSEVNILCYPTSSKSKDIYSIFLNEIITYRVRDYSLSEKIKISLDNISKEYCINSSDNMSEILKTLITDDYFGIYDVLNILAKTNNLENILTYISSKDYLIYLFNKCYFKNKHLTNECVTIFRERFNQLITPILMLFFRFETFGIDFDKELSFYSHSKVGIKEKLELQNELVDNLYDKAKYILTDRIIMEYMDARFEIELQELEQLINTIFNKEDIAFAVKNYFEGE